MKQDGLLNIHPLSPELLPLAERFSSGNTYLDGFLQDGDYSLNANIGKTYVFLSEENSEIIGYYNLGMSSVDRIEEVGESSRYIRMGGAVNINYFELDEKYHKQVFDILPSGDKIQLSDILIIECLERIEMIAQEYIGATFVTLNSTKEGYNLYKRNGFEELEMDMRFTMEDSDHNCTQLYKWINEEFQINKTAGLIQLYWLPLACNPLQNDYGMRQIMNVKSDLKQEIIDKLEKAVYNITPIKIYQLIVYKNI